MVLASPEAIPNSVTVTYFKNERYDLSLLRVKLGINITSAV